MGQRTGFWMRKGSFWGRMGVMLKVFSWEGMVMTRQKRSYCDPEVSGRNFGTTWQSKILLVLVCAGLIFQATAGASDFSAIAGGGYHAIALKTDGTVWPIFYTFKAKSWI